MISGVVLAAGGSTRMGSPKLQMELLGRPLLSYSLDAFGRSQVDEIILVVPDEATWSLGGQTDKKVKVVLNKDWREGMSSSLKLGIRTVSGEAAVVGLGDQPLLRSSTIDELIGTYWSTAARIVVPVHDGRRGNPVLFDRLFFPQILKLEGDVGAKSVIGQNPESLGEVLVDDYGVILDVDTPNDLQRAESELNRRSPDARGHPQSD